MKFLIYTLALLTSANCETTASIKQKFVDLRHKELFGGYSCNNIGFGGKLKDLAYPNIKDLPGCEITINNDEKDKNYKFYLCTQPSELNELELRYRSTGWSCYP